ncbi:MAG: hypothetical protein ACLGGX_08165, partial [Bdellovibrionia bacterium]
MKHFLIFGLFLVLGFAGFMMVHVGAFKPVEIEQKNIEVIYLLAKNHMGPYHTTVKAIEEVEAWALNNKLDCRFSFGQYLDNPDQIDSDRLRSRGGCMYFGTKPTFENVPTNYEWIEIPA